MSLLGFGATRGGVLGEDFSESVDDFSDSAFLGERGGDLGETSGEPDDAECFCRFLGASAGASFGDFSDLGDVTGDSVCFLTCCSTSFGWLPNGLLANGSDRVETTGCLGTVTFTCPLENGSVADF